MALFELGAVVITTNAVQFCADHDINPAILIQRHATGDWGDLDSNDVGANERAIALEFRIFSSYKFAVGKVWVITEADRSSTCVLLPEDY